MIINSRSTKSTKKEKWKTGNYDNVNENISLQMNNNILTFLVADIAPALTAWMLAGIS